MIMVLGGCASGPAAVAVAFPATTLSPVPELVAPRDAWPLAEAYVREHPGSEVVVGSGNSMLPLYRDRTVLVLQPIAMGELQRTMTVVFVGDQGRPVAHVLTEKTARGWRAIGMGNHECDLTLVRYDNLIGVVVKAYAPATPPPRLVRETAPSNSAGVVVSPAAPDLAALEPRNHGAGNQ
jgi:hypothetical protein